MNSGDVIVNCHATEKSEDIAACKELPVIPGNKVVYKRRIIGKRMADEAQSGKRQYWQ
jgi:hypothetical protein